MLLQALFLVGAVVSYMFCLWYVLLHFLVLVEKTDDAEQTATTGEITCENISAACDGKALNLLKYTLIWSVAWFGTICTI